MLPLLPTDVVIIKTGRGFRVLFLSVRPIPESLLPELGADVVVTARLRDEAPAGVRPLATLGLERPRRLALTATAALIAALFVGELWGPVIVRQLTQTLG